MRQSGEIKKGGAMEAKSGATELKRGGRSSTVSVRQRSSEERAKVQAHKANRGSTMTTAVQPVLEYAVPRRKAMLSETDRWLRLASKIRPFLAGLEAYLASLFSVAIACECPTLTQSSTYATVALTLPKELLALVRARQRATGADSFRPVAQERLSAFEMLERCLVAFRCVAAERDAVSAHVASKGTMDAAHVVQLQWFYKYFLRILNHWNYSHRSERNGIPVSLQRSFFVTVSERGSATLLGTIVNELDLLRDHIFWVDPMGTLAQKQQQEAGKEIDDDEDEDEGDDADGDSSQTSGGPSGTTSPSVLSPRAGDSVPVQQQQQQQQPPLRDRVQSMTSIPGLSSTPSSSRTSQSQVRLSSGHLSPRIVTTAEKMAVLQGVYTNEQYRAEFLEFARSKYAEENVTFLCAVVAIREAAVEQRKALFDALVREYLDVNSVKEVNLSGKARRLLLSGTSFDNLSFMDLAWSEVEHQVVQNLCGPFVERVGSSAPPSAASSAPPSPRSSLVSPSTVSPPSSATSPLASPPPPAHRAPSPPTLSPSRVSRSGPLDPDALSLALDVALVKERVKSPGRRASILGHSFEGAVSPKLVPSVSPPLSVASPLSAPSPPLSVASPPLSPQSSSPPSSASVRVASSSSRSRSPPPSGRMTALGASLDLLSGSPLFNRRREADSDAPAAAIPPRSSSSSIDLSPPEEAAAVAELLSFSPTRQGLRASGARARPARLPGTDAADDL